MPKSHVLEKTSLSLQPKASSLSRGGGWGIQASNSKVDKDNSLGIYEKI